MAHEEKLRTWNDEQRLTAGPDNPYENRELAPGIRPVSEAVRNFAAERGQLDAAGNVDLSGLTLDHLPLPSNGEPATEPAAEGEGDNQPQPDYTYTVDQRVVTTQVRRDTKPGFFDFRRRRPNAGFLNRNWHMRTEASMIVTDEFGKREEDTTEVDLQHSVVDVQVTNKDGNIVAELSFGTQGDFYSFLDGHEPEKDRKQREEDATQHGYYQPDHLMAAKQDGNGNVPLDPIDVESFRWGEEKAKAPAELDPDDRHEIDIELDPSDKEVLKQVFESREELENVPGESLVGFTIMKVAFEEPIPGDLRKTTHKLQVTGDGLMYGGDRHGRPYVRFWEITEFDDQDRPVKQHKRFYRDDELMVLLDKKAYPSLKDDEVQDWVDKDVPELVNDREWAKVRDHTYFTNPHWEIPKQTLQEGRRAAGRARRAVEDAEGDPDAQVLLLSSLMVDMDTEYKLAAEKLKILGSDDDPDAGIIALHQKLRDEAGMWLLVNGSHQAIKGRRSIIDEAIGRAFINRLMQHPKITNGGPKAVNDGGAFDVKAKAQPGYAPDTTVLNSLQDFVEPGLHKLVDKLTKTRNKALRDIKGDNTDDLGGIELAPTAEEARTVGRWLRRQLIDLEPS